MGFKPGPDYRGLPKSRARVVVTIMVVAGLAFTGGRALGADSGTNRYHRTDGIGPRHLVMHCPGVAEDAWAGWHMVHKPKGWDPDRSLVTLRCNKY